MKYLLDAGTLSAALRGRLPVVLKLAELGPGEIAMSVLSRMQVEIGLRTKSGAKLDMVQSIVEGNSAIVVRANLPTKHRLIEAG